MSNFEEFKVISQLIAKELVKLLSVEEGDHHKLLERLDLLRTEVRNLKLSHKYKYDITNKKQKKYFELTIKQLEAGVNKVEKVLIEGNPLAIF